MMPTAGVDVCPLTPFSFAVFSEFFHTPQNSQRLPAPTRTAASVKGTPMRRKSLVRTRSPFLRRMPMAAMLADAQMGVRLPPSVAPVSRPN